MKINQGGYSLPLLVFFLLQCLLIGLSFFAVIYELTRVQQKQFHDAVYNQINLRMRLTNRSLQAPIRIREVAFANIAYKMAKIRKHYILTEDKKDITHMENFFDDLFVLVDKDPLVTSVLQLRRSTSLINPDGVAVIGAAGIIRFKGRVIFLVSWNESFEVAPQNGFPTQYKMVIRPPKPFNVTYLDWPLPMLAAKRPMWLNPLFIDKPLSHVRTFINSLVYPFDDLVTGRNVLSYTTNMSALAEIVDEMLTTPKTEACLVLTADEFLLKSTTSEYKGLHLHELPDRKMYATFIEARGKCNAAGEGVCELYTYETKLFGNGEVHIASFLHMTTPLEFDMELLLLTPRSFFFEEGDRTIMAGIIIGCCVAVIVLLSSIAIWKAIHHPLLKLQGNMQLAAEMRNNEVDIELQYTLLREILTLQQSFRRMNENLLAARPFMPQALLCLNDKEGEEEDYGEDVKCSKSSSDIASIEISCSITNINTHISHNSVKCSPFHGRSQSASTICIETTLTRRNVAVLSVNVCGWHTIVKKREFEGCSDQLHTVLCEMIERRSGLAKGIIDSFQGDHFIVTFNAAKVVGSPAKRAARMALDIEMEVGAAFKHDQHSHHGLLTGAPSLGAFHRTHERVQGFSMGLSAGMAYVGNLGTAKIKKFCTIGQCFSIAMSLERLAKRLGRLCVLDSRTLPDVELDVYFLLLGEAELVAPPVSNVAGIVPCKATVSPGLIQQCSSLPSPSLDKVYALMEWIVSAHDDEWLYEVHGRQQGDPYRELNAILSVALVEVNKYRRLSTPLPLQGPVSTNNSNRRIETVPNNNNIVSEKEGPLGTTVSTLRKSALPLEVALIPSLRALASQLGIQLSSDSETVASLLEHCYQSLSGHETGDDIYNFNIGEVPVRGAIVTDEVIRVAWLLFLEIERMIVIANGVSHQCRSSPGPSAARAALTSVVSMVLQSSPSSACDKSNSCSALDAALTTLYFEKF